MIKDCESSRSTRSNRTSRKRRETYQEVDTRKGFNVHYGPIKIKENLGMGIGRVNP
jgi:hypothetical protein